MIAMREFGSFRHSCHTPLIWLRPPSRLPMPYALYKALFSDLGFWV